MVHMGVILLIVRMKWTEGWNTAWITAFASFAISIFIAAVLYQLVELPFRRGIVDFAEGRGFRSFLSAFGRPLGAWLRSPAFLIPACLATTSVVLLTQFRFDERSDTKMQQVIAQSPQVLRNIHFEDDAILEGVSTSQTPDGGLKIEMVWNLKTGRRSQRFIKLLGDANKVVGRGDNNRQLFETATGDERVIDQVVIPANKMLGVESIAVGFFERERKSAVVASGPRSAKNRQLHIWYASGNNSN